MTDYLHEQAKAQVKSIIERLERLEADKAAILEDIKQVYLEAKGNGFDAKALRKVVAIRKKAEHQRLEEEALLATYLQALGMIPGDVGKTANGRSQDTAQTDLEEFTDAAVFA